MADQHNILESCSRNCLCSTAHVVRYLFGNKLYITRFNGLVMLFVCLKDQKSFGKFTERGFRTVFDI